MMQMKAGEECKIETMIKYKPIMIEKQDNARLQQQEDGHRRKDCFFSTNNYMQKEMKIKQHKYTFTHFILIFIYDFFKLFSHIFVEA